MENDMYAGTANVSRETFHRLGAEYEWDRVKQPRPGEGAGNAGTRPQSSSARQARPALLLPRRAHLMKLQGTTTAPDPPRGNRRGVVVGFSYQSRMRLMEFVACIDRTCRPDHWLFITLTYPGEYPLDPATWKHHLNRLRKCLARDFPAIAALWKMEYQERGAPHYHLLCYGARFIHHHYIAQVWADIVNSGDPAHLAAGTRVERPRTWNGVAFYASKYIGKVEQNETRQAAGRIWGVMGRKNLPIDKAEYPLTWEQFNTIRRRMGRWARGAKPLPWVEQSSTERPDYEIKRTKAARGCKLFVNEAVGLRLVRDLLPDTQNGPDNPPNQAQNGVLDTTLLPMPPKGTDPPAATTAPYSRSQQENDTNELQKGRQAASSRIPTTRPPPRTRPRAAPLAPGTLRRVWHAVSGVAPDSRTGRELLLALRERAAAEEAGRVRAPADGIEPAVRAWWERVAPAGRG